MKINHYVCDICGERFENGEGFKINITYPIEEKYMNMKSRYHYRKTKKMDLCIGCAVERLDLHEAKED